MKNLFIFMFIVTFLGGCGETKLDRKLAKNILQSKYTSGTQTYDFKLCPKQAVEDLRNGSRFTDQQCNTNNENVYNVFVRGDNAVFVGFTSPISSIYQFIDKVKPSLADSQYIKINGYKVTVSMYDFKVGEIHNIRIIENSEKCDAHVEWDYARENYAPWGKEYFEKIYAGPSVQKSCFQKTDAGWRVIP